jgi:hypothetical protein
MAVSLSTDARAALEAGHLAHLVTVNADGSPQVSIAWVGVEGDEVVSAHLDPTQRSWPMSARVVLSLETGGRNEIGLDH